MPAVPDFANAQSGLQHSYGLAEARLVRREPGPALLIERLVIQQILRIIGASTVSDVSCPTTRAVMRWILAAFYVAGGVAHLAVPGEFLKITGTRNACQRADSMKSGPAARLSTPRASSGRDCFCSAGFQRRRVAFRLT
jgi:hypothetical protein